MNWLTDRHIFLIAVVGYLASTVYSVFLWRKGFREDNRNAYLLMLLSFAFHTAALFQRGFRLNQCPVNNLFEGTLFIGWTLAGAYLLVGLMPKLRFLGVFASPVLLILGVFALMPALDPPHGPKPVFVNPLASLHAALIFLAFGSFGLGFAAALLYLSQEHDLKFRKMRAFLSVLPPIERLERVARNLVVAGLVLLTAGLALYPFLLKDKPHLPAKPDPSLIWAFIIWTGYLGLLLFRWKGRAGKPFAWGAVVSFIFILLTYWGIILLSPIHKSS